MPDLSTIDAIANRSVGDSEISFDNIEESLGNLEEALQIEFASTESDTPATPPENRPDNQKDIPQNNSDTLEESIVQIPAMIRELIAATQNPQLVTPQEGLAQFSDLIRDMDMRPERRAQFDQLLDTTQLSAPTFAPVLAQMNERFDQIDTAIQLDRAENNRLIQDIIAWGNNSKTLEEIPSLAGKISGKAHLAQSANKSYLASLDPSILNPLSSVVAPSIQSLSPLLSVTTTAPVPAPSDVTTFATMVDEQGLRKAQ